MYERSHARQRKEKQTKGLKTVPLNRLREKHVEDATWDLIEKVAGNQLRSVVIVGVMKDGYVWNRTAAGVDRFPIIGALESMKLDLMNVESR